MSRFSPVGVIALLAGIGASAASGLPPEPPEKVPPAAAAKGAVLKFQPRSKVAAQSSSNLPSPENGCGDGWCDGSNENCWNCSEDCGGCVPCGDGLCNSAIGESCSSCVEDCGSCSSCGNGVCDFDEDFDHCLVDCPPPPPPPPLPPDPRCIGMNTRILPLTGCDAIGPSPTPGGNCNCVVRIDTTRRAVTGNTLYQECNKHYGHGSCPGCSDFPHSVPYGNWAVELTGAAAAGSLPSVSTSGASRGQNCSQWPGSEPGRGTEWNTCTCDSAHYPANQVATTRARAGWFKIQSGASDCSPLNTGSLTAGFTLGIWELDPGFLTFFDDDDEIATIPGLVSFSSFTCTPSTGTCRATATMPLIGAGGAVDADGLVEIECQGRPFPPPCQSECGTSVFCGTDRCGNFCGGCPAGQSCLAGICHQGCTACLGQQCGWDLACNSGSFCGDCGAGFTCNSFGSCEPSCTACAGQTCGTDRNCGSGAWCGGCPPDYFCNGLGLCEYTNTCVLTCGDGICCSSEASPSSWSYCPADCGGVGGGGGGGGSEGGGGCTCDCDGDGWVTPAECEEGCGGRVEGGSCLAL